jgi:hypothetical protein
MLHFSLLSFISLIIRLVLIFMFDPDANLPIPNKRVIYWGACLIAGIRLAREKQVSVLVIPTIQAIEESVDLGHEIFNRVFRRVPERINQK